MGATWETLAFIFRAAGAHDQQQPTWQILGTLFLLLAPLWINAFVYMVVARLVYYVLPSQKVWGVRAALLTKLFVWLDVVTFLVQVTGGILMSNQEPDSQDIVRKGQQVYMIGISVQGALILVFGAMTARFYLVMKKEGRADRNLKRARILVWVTFAVLVLILVSKLPHDSLSPSFSLRHPEFSTSCARNCPGMARASSGVEWEESDWQAG